MADSPGRGTISMQLPDGRPFVVDEGVLAESVGPGGRLVLWLPGEHRAGSRHWERVATVAGAAVDAASGISTLAATSTPARQRVGTGLGGLVRRFVGAGDDGGLTLPGGGSAEPCGPRRTGLVLAWSGDGAAPLDEAGIRSRWPDHRDARRVGPGVWLVAGIGLGRASGAAGSVRAAPARRLAEETLAAARRAGDRRREVTALADLGLALLLEGDGLGAWTAFEESLDGARRLGDRAQEADAANNLALAALVLGRSDRVRELVEPALAHAREAGDRYAETFAWERLGLACREAGEHARASEFLERALMIARGLGNRQHEAVLLWQVAIQQAELGRVDRAALLAQESIDLLRRLGKPQADWYAGHLAAYRSSKEAASPAAPAGAPLHLGGSISTSAVATSPSPPPAARAPAGPGVLRMAISATQAMAKFVGSGFRTVAPEAQRARLAVCAACEQYTGMRCRACGCIAAAKARMMHEDCPAGKWPR